MQFVTSTQVKVILRKLVQRSLRNYCHVFLRAINQIYQCSLTREKVRRMHSAKWSVSMDISTNT